LKTSTKFLALGAACAACCALPFVVPLLAGSAVLELFGPAEASYVAVLATAAALAAFVFMRGKPSASCAASDASCGCADNPKLLKLVAPQEAVHVTITAPEEARDAANALFAHFAPEWAHDSTSVSPKPKEPAPS
jgi:hypothetical protein